MRQDVALTSKGMPALVLGETRYPLLFSVSGIKEFAEHQGKTFKAMISDGWDASEMDDDELRTLLGVALRGGERRRMMFEGPPAHDISEALLDQLFEVMHRIEIAVLLAVAWNQPPREPDPQTPATNTPTGEPLSE